MPTTEEFREASVEYSVTPGLFLLRRMSGQETMGRLGCFDLELLSETPNIDLNTVLAQPMAVRLNQPSGEKRFFHGYVTRISYAGSISRYFVYRARLEPWLSFLKHSTECRIYQDKTVVEILEAVFGDYKIQSYENYLSGAYPPIDYCVQYRETTFNFVSRLMEHWGIYYYFEHTKEQHKLILRDDMSTHSPVPGYEQLRFQPGGTNANSAGETIKEWVLSREVQSGAVELRDYDFKRANQSISDGLEVRELDALPISQEGDHARYDYPGRYMEVSTGSRLARSRLEAEKSQFETVQVKTDARGVSPGALFDLIEHSRQDQNAEYLITSACYEYQTDEYGVDLLELKVDIFDDVTDGSSFSCSFTAVPSTQNFRLRQTTRKPFVQGPQTAMVVGKSGEEVWTDEYGRVRVHFHWDRIGAGDETDTCWIRVSQGWAGKGWGSMFIPRIGHEVLVSFLEGDPDQPIITGSVYNSDAMPPYTLPGEATKSTIKSNSSKGGDGFNEIRFEDKKGEEEVYVHAEKDFSRVVENDDSLTVGLEDKNPGNQTIRIHNNQSIDIGKVCTIEAGQKIELIVGGSSITIEPSKITIKTTTLEIDASASIKIASGGTLEMTSGATMDIKAGAVLSASGALVKIN